MPRLKGFFFPGDVVRCIKKTHFDNPLSEPLDYPVVGQTYVLTSIYLNPYGCGCTLAGLDVSPYAGYALSKNTVSGHENYFELIEGE